MATPNQEANTIINVFVNNWVCLHGFPIEPHSDQNKNFESAVLKEMCELYSIKKTWTAPLHLQLNGMVERLNWTVKEYFPKVVNEQQKDIPEFLLAYPSAVNDSTSRLPAKIIFGTEIKLPGDLEFDVKSANSPTERDTTYTGKENELHECVRTRIKMHSDKMKARCDRAANTEGYREGRFGLFPKLQTSSNN